MAFVTGGAGFIGSHLVDRLMAEGNRVTVYDNLSSGRKEFIAHHLENPLFKFIQGDLLEEGLLRESMNGHDIVFHLAANPEAREGNFRTRLDLEQNTMATYNFLESMRVNGVKRLVFTSSGTVYAEAPGIPLQEEYGPMLPISLYGASKLACEGLISAFCHLFEMQAWILRLGNIIGSRSTHGVIFDLLGKLRRNPKTLQVLGDGRQTKPYVYIDDCIDGMLFCFRNSHDGVNLFNISTSTETSVREIVSMLLQKTGATAVVEYTGGERGWPGDVPRVKLNPKKAEALGWTARYTSDEAVARAIDALIEGNASQDDRF